ncbi:MAG: carbohydrate-binding domain-containing protein [Clostridia bacterium]|nr:carbohydrate-binding domain-containing protein [Clostridia bacterium]
MKSTNSNNTLPIILFAVILAVSLIIGVIVAASVIIKKINQTGVDNTISYSENEQGALIPDSLSDKTGDVTSSDSTSSEETPPATGEGSVSEDPGTDDTNSVTDVPYEEIEGITTIVLSGTAATVNGEGAVLQNDGLVLITAAGEYEISGSFTGQIRVRAAEKAKVKLTLKGVNITNSSDSCIYVESADKVTIKNQKGYTNVINDTDSSEESDTDTRGKAAIYSKASLELSGNGTMSVTSSYNHAIATTKKLTVSGGTLTLTAKGTGLKGNNSVSVESGSVTIKSEGDGIKCEEEEDEEKGFILISGGTIDITTESDGIYATRTLLVTGGNITITTTGNDKSNSTGNQFGGGGPGGRPGRPGQGGYGGTTTSLSTDVSSKGIKCGCDSVGTSATLTISGGVINITSTGHAVHSTGNINIDGTPSITVSSSQKGFQAHNVLTVEGGTINITKSTEGLESKSDMYIKGGTITAYSTDDGINIGGKGKTLYISGGYTDLTTSSGDTDGIDSNGNISVTGGFLIVKGGSASGNVAGSIDVDGKITVTGGTVVALGGICETPASNSTARCITFQRKTFSSGSYTITDSSGKVLYEFTLSGNYSSCWIASESFKSGNTYNVCRHGSTLYSAKA